MGRIRNWFNFAILHNPMAMKELRSRMRGSRSFTFLTGYLILVSGFIWLIYFSYVSTTSAGGYGDPAELGTLMFTTILVFQALLAIITAPSMTVNAITGEKERQTYELLRTTLLTAPALVLGKLISALSFTLILIFVAVPIQSLAFVLGGVTLSDLLLSQVVIVVTAGTFALTGIYFSSRMQRTASANAATFGVILFLVIGIPIMFVFFDLFGNSFDDEVLATINFIGALVCSVDGCSSYLPSYIYIGIYLFLGAVFFRLTISRIRRID